MRASADDPLLHAEQLTLFDLRPFTIEWRFCAWCGKMVNARTNAGHFAACVTLNPRDPS